MTSTPESEDPQDHGTVPLGKPNVPPSAEPSQQPGAAGTGPSYQPPPGPPPGPAGAPPPSGAQPQYGAPQAGHQPPYGAPQAGHQQPYGHQPGAPLNPSDERMWATLGHAAGPVATIISVGTLGWAAPLIIFLVFKDRSRFVRDQSAEALNFQITLIVAYVAIGLLTLITFGLLSILFLVPVILVIVFGIMGAIATNRGESYRYPINIRLVK